MVHFDAFLFFGILMMYDEENPILFIAIMAEQG